jgi:hypothetical protein
VAQAAPFVYCSLVHLLAELATTQQHNNATISIDLGQTVTVLGTLPTVHANCMSETIIVYSSHDIVRMRSGRASAFEDLRLPPSDLIRIHENITSDGSKCTEFRSWFGISNSS